MKRNYRRVYDKGITLLLTIGVLVLLLIIALTFVAHAILERAASINRSYKVRADFAAISGLWYAITHLTTDLSAGEFGNPYAEWIYSGEDINRNGKLDKVISPGEPLPPHLNKLKIVGKLQKQGNKLKIADKLQKQGEDINNNGKLDIVNLPVEESLVPSYPTLVEIGGEEQIVSNVFSIGRFLITNKLQIFDANAKIYINDGNLAEPGAVENKRIIRILNNLGNQLEISNLGERIIKARPTNGYRLLFDLKKNKVLSNDEYEKVKDFLTVRAYVDEKVVEPLGYSARGFGKPYPDINGNNNIIAKYSQFVPKELKLVGRAPINVNLAPKEILVAVLEGLSGIYIDDSTQFNMGAFTPSLSNMGDSSSLIPVGIEANFFSAKVFPLGVVKETTPISYGQAVQIADEIIDYRSKKFFLSYQEFDEFCDKLVSRGIIDKYQADVLKANFNPNLNSNYINPDGILHKFVDKLSLTTNSTEFSFVPMGYFYITSLGRVWFDEKLVAESKYNAFVKIYDVLVDTLQEDFIGNDFSTVDKQISKIDRSYTPIFSGTRLDLSLETYPVGMTKDGRTSSYEGYLMLSTYINALEKVYNKTTLRASFNNGLIADLSNTKREVLSSDVPDPYYLPDGSYSEIYKELKYDISKKFSIFLVPRDSLNPFGRSGRTLRLFSSANENNVKIEGIVFAACHEFPPPTEPPEPPPPPPRKAQVGTIFFWFKPNWGEHTNRGHTLYSMSRFSTAANMLLDQQHWFLAYLPIEMNVSAPIFGLKLLFKATSSPSDTFSCVYRIPNGSLMPHQWYHIAIYFDTSKPIASSAHLFLNGARLQPYCCESVSGDFSDTTDITEDITEGLRFGDTYRKKYILQSISQVFDDPASWGIGSADSTFDEINIMDGNPELNLPEKVFKLGRYYNGPEATFTSLKKTEKDKKLLVYNVMLPGLYIPARKTIDNYSYSSLTYPEFEVYSQIIGTSEKTCSPIKVYPIPETKAVDMSAYCKGPYETKEWFRYKLIIKNKKPNETLLFSPVINDVLIFYSVYPSEDVILVSYLE